MLTCFEVTVCFLQETFLKSRHDHQMTNYNLVRCDRAGARGGGTAIAVHNSLEARTIPLKELAELRVLEATAVMLQGSRGKKLFLISIYRRPKDRRRFTGDLQRIFERLNLDREENNYIIGGDFNAMHPQWRSRRTSERGNELLAFVQSTSPFYNIRLLAASVPSRPLTGGYPDLILLRHSVDISPIEEGEVNVLPVVAASYSDHMMMFLECRLGEGPWTPPPPVGRLEELRCGVARLRRDKFVGNVLGQCRRRGLNENALAAVAEQNLCDEQLNELTEALSETVVSAMEKSMPPEGDGNTIRSPGCEGATTTQE